MFNNIVILALALSTFAATAQAGAYGYANGACTGNGESVPLDSNIHGRYHSIKITTGEPYRSCPVVNGKCAPPDQCTQIPFSNVGKCLAISPDCLTTG